MKRLLLSFFVAFLLSETAFSQIHNVYIGSGSSTLFLTSTADPHGAGFPDRYLNSDWKKGSVITTNKTMLNNVGLRYNLSTGEFEIVSTLNPKVVKRINLDGKVFVYTDYLDASGKTKSSYFQLLSEGSTRLLLLRHLKRKPGKKGLYGYDPYETVQEVYFIQNGNNPAVQVKRNKKSILSALPGHDRQLEEWLRKHSVSFYKISDLAKLLKYYNSLASS